MAYTPKITGKYLLRDINVQVIFQTNNPRVACQQLHDYVLRQDRAHFIKKGVRKLEIDVHFYTNRFGDHMVVIRTPVYHRFIAALVGITQEEYIKYSPLEQAKRARQALVEKLSGS